MQIRVRMMMIRISGWMVMACAVAQAGEDHGWLEKVAWMASPELRGIDQRLGEIAAELAGLPGLLESPVASRYGFRSEMLQGPEQPHWLMIDLGRRVEIDCLAVVPTNVPLLGERGAGYGFPRRFKIELADGPEMENAATLVDRTASDVENPGRHPLIFRIEPAAGRWLRFTSTRHAPVEGGFLWALEEIVVLNGNSLVALNRPSVASSNLELFPNWSAQRVNNGMSGLGLPVTVERSPTRGFLSESTDDPNDEKWLMVDLGEEYAVDDVRLVPVEATHFEVMGRRALPRSLTVEMANDPEFSETIWSENRFFNHPALPGSNALVIPAFGARGRYVRLVAHELWGRTHGFGFGLAEIQVIANGRNVALGRPVAVSDAAPEQEFPWWSPEFAVDGFSSRYRLIDWPEYLVLIERRCKIERRRDALLRRRDGKVRATGLILGYGGGGLAVAIAASFGALLLRQRTIRRTAVARLREQIARDLHDDIGSNLGGIVLLSEIGSRHSDDTQAREDFAAIKDAAEETSKSMQDIVWLIDHGQMGLRDLLARMRQVAQAILGDKSVSFTIEPPDFRDRELSLMFRRHVFFAFKETLNNVRRHAAASEVEIRITVDPARFRFNVRDDGVGFDPARRIADEGHGLANLQRRADRLGGTCRIGSQPGGGTRVVFESPLKA